MQADLQVGQMPPARAPNIGSATPLPPALDLASQAVRDRARRLERRAENSRMRRPAPYVPPEALMAAPLPA
eukprot:16441581-Heterocapsa_arctica.AAC.1